MSVSQLFQSVLKSTTSWSSSNGRNNIDPPKVHIAVVGLSGSGRRSFLDATQVGDVVTRHGGDGDGDGDDAAAVSAANTADESSSVQVDVVSSDGGGVQLSSWPLLRRTTNDAEGHECGGGGGGSGGAAAAASRRVGAGGRLQPQQDYLQSVEAVLRKGSDFGRVTCLVVVVDALDQPSWKVVRDQLHSLYAAEFLSKAPLLVVANKCETSDSVKTSVIAAAVGAEHWVKGRQTRCFSVPCRLVGWLVVAGGGWVRQSHGCGRNAWSVGSAICE